MSRFQQTTSILRIFNEAKARAFYIDYLGAKVVFEHRFWAKAPLYLGIDLGGVTLHLTQHRGDCASRGRVRIECTDIHAWAAHLSAKPAPLKNPATPERQPWGEWDLTLLDPFKNRLSFHQAV